jgi:hypothetical protein
MIMTASLLVLGISIGVLFLLFAWKEDVIPGPYIYSDTRYVLGRVAVIGIGIGISLIGFSIYASNKPAAGFGGSLMVVLGGQVALWSAGVRLDFLGNVSTVSVDSPGNRFTYRRRVQRVGSPFASQLRILSGFLKGLDDSYVRDSTEGAVGAVLREQLYSAWRSSLSFLDTLRSGAFEAELDHRVYDDLSQMVGNGVNDFLNWSGMLLSGSHSISYEEAAQRTDRLIGLVDHFTFEFPAVFDVPLVVGPTPRGSGSSRILSD